ncbi:RNase H phosphoglycerate/bisphosphoglycerate mutase domain protein [Mycobacterium kansasii]|uniref:RNase H phosphoglycerate/bisphosphoglycerate mutase domain protein n=1 Tax=Mycobacterium kansasii TaxID=1768 RepID=A0A1V3WYL7_MYCKA|nr:RNase H phosphoglycerate/bisphosphoglycerate mutase domain protein [Mycobacterium kansasii]
MQLGVAFGSLRESHSLPCAEVGLDEVVVDGHLQAQGPGRRRRRVIGPLQRRGHHRRDPAALR